MDKVPIYRRSLLAAFAIFAMWEAANHLLLMSTPMWVQHTSAAIIEVGLALVILTVALRSLAAQQRELDRTREARDRLASALANDLRQPLVEVVESLRELDERGALSSRTRKVIERATESVRPLVGMAAELLGVISAEDENREFQSLNCSPLLYNAFYTIRPIAAAKQVELQVDVPEVLPIIRGMPHSILRTLLILLDNAVRATPNGGEVLLAAQAIGNRAINIIIADGGLPLSEEAWKALMQDSGEQRKADWLEERPLRSGHRYCATVLRTHGGSVEVESSQEKGNTIILSLPVAERATF
ncbi:MAG: hypothetical protein GTO55_07225 [Armatimonadetes bacterium]|nr:hypothetical protein [Armatimonadota bacterium]NIM24062.1 hypothetical protein [Armatimonadota bacterium]NIM67916.1 hypothetical protein [Armatimonadota bacterium]NIM76438.1 hypothetical protein [Armatimonadota bacterium]NIN06146.1 hypothetical protein [Armatimonadota bacterium]